MDVKPTNNGPKKAKYRKILRQQDEGDNDIIEKKKRKNFPFEAFRYCLNFFRRL